VAKTWAIEWPIIPAPTTSAFFTLSAFMEISFWN
jgi:hypothetical protein